MNTLPALKSQMSFLLHIPVWMTTSSQINMNYVFFLIITKHHEYVNNDMFSS